MTWELRQATRALVEAERGTIRKEGRFRVTLCHAARYSVAMSSLGFQVIYRLLNARPDFVCERATYPDDPAAFRASRTPLYTLESERPVAESDLIAFSIAFEPDILHLVDMLDLSGLAPLRADRGPSDPPIVVGGPITTSNALPLGPFADVVVNGDGEEAIQQLMDAVQAGGGKDALLRTCADLPGFWVPELHGERVPDNLRVGREHLPAAGQIVTPHAELSNMFLIEASRGCPRFCTFCVIRATVQPMRESDLAALLGSVPDWAPRVGFVGAAVSDYEHIKEAIEEVVRRGKGVGVSSLRADRLDVELVDLLRRGGYRTLTVASDAASERLRSKLMKGIRDRHIIRAAELARQAGMRTLKLYVIVGLPDETDEDLDELIAMGRSLAAIGPLALTLSPFVPKLHTPLAHAPFAGMKSVDQALDRVRKGLRGVADVRAASSRWAWIEYRLSQGGQDAGLAVHEAWRAGGGFAAWRKALGRCEDERAGLHAVQAAGLWEPTGVVKGAPRPPRPPKRLRRDAFVTADR